MCCSSILRDASLRLEWRCDKGKLSGGRGTCRSHSQKLQPGQQHGHSLPLDGCRGGAPQPPLEWVSLERLDQPRRTPGDRRQLLEGLQRWRHAAGALHSDAVPLPQRIRSLQTPPSIHRFSPTLLIPAELGYRLGHFDWKHDTVLS